MKRHAITAIADIDRRAPEAGRIRLGIQTKAANGKMRPASINTLRFTSPDRAVIEQIAARYGGTVEAWDEPKASPSHQWQVITESNEVRVYLPSDGLSTWYELWKATGGNLRRCDGVTCATPQLCGDGDYEMVDVPCICAAKGALECTAVSRLTVILPEFAFLGTWRLDTKGWNAHQELPGMYDLIQELNRRGHMADAVLSVERREKQTPTGKRNFVVPRLAVRTSVEELQSGTPVGSIGTGPHSALSVVPELNAGVQVGDQIDIVEAEVISEELLEVEARLRADAANFGLDEDMYVEAVKAQTDGEIARMRVCSDKVRAEVIEPIGFANNRVQWRTK